MNSSFSPEQIKLLGQALDCLIERYGPFEEEEKAALAEALIRLGEMDVWDLVQLTEGALRSVRAKSFFADNIGMKIS
jgi:hypothetical protein